MNEEITQKLKETRKFLNKFIKVFPIEFDRFISNTKVKEASIACSEILIESLIELSTIVAKEKCRTIPRSSSHAFELLCKGNVVPVELLPNYKKIIELKNSLSGEYGKETDERLFERLKNLDTKKIEEFINHLENQQ